MIEVAILLVGSLAVVGVIALFNTVSGGSCDFGDY